MDRRSWPWKKKSSDKSATEKVIATLESAGAPSDLAGSLGKPDNNKKPKYVQISVESYSHLTGLEDQMTSYDDKVKELEDEVEELNEKLSAANLEMVAKESLVKQHSKVAEEAVSGWEKAEAEALELKNHLESVTLLKLTAEERASHLDGALKECMRQIRNLTEEHEQTLHEVVVLKTKQCDMIKLELEAQIDNLGQELRRSASDNAAISRTLQERSNMLVKITEEKTQAEAEIERLKSNVDSCDREISSLKYELHIVAKELEIRNEEKNMSVRSAEVANKQHLEGVKKIAKLEAECQRLRGLVRKKLPGPAALAQMKLEVESMGRDSGESRLRRSPVKPPTSPHSPHMTTFTEFSHENVQKYQKEIELLTERYLEMEEETKMLKEALTKRNSELQASRSVCAKTVSKVQCLEVQLQANNQHRNASKFNGPIPAENYFSQNASNPPSLASMSENGHDDGASCAGSWAMSELSNFNKARNIDSPNKSENSNRLGLMDDFLEMEKLAYSSKISNESSPSSDSNRRKFENVNHDLSEATAMKALQSKHQPGSESLMIESSNGEDLAPYIKLQSKISMIFETASKESDLENLLEHIRNAIQDMDASLHQNSASSNIKEPYNTVGHCEAFPENSEDIAGNVSSLSQDTPVQPEAVFTIDEELTAAVSQIYEFVLLLGKEFRAVQTTPLEGDEFTKILAEFSAAFNEVKISRISLNNFVLCLSQVFSRASYFRFGVLGYKHVDTEGSTSDCIDKVALPENKAVTNSTQQYANGFAHFSDSTSDPDIPHDSAFVPTSEVKASSRKCSLEDLELLKSEKDNIVIDLARSTENLVATRSRLQETEELLAEVKSQLASAQKSNGLAETQLKCMAESYRSLERHAEELQIKADCLQTKADCLDSELQVERRNHEDSLARYKDLQEELKRIESFPVIQVDAKGTQETELASAAQKLAECQETISLLGKHLNSMRPQMEFGGSPTKERTPKKDGIFAEDKITTGIILQDVNKSESDSFRADMHRVGSDSDIFSTPISPSFSEANNLSRSPISSKHYPKHRPTKSSSSSSSTPTPEKHRGISRFFSTKTKIEH
ncbi:filament-like plant protein 4 [Heracleum sosnowskyi]|uniref:Filament-like plant protein 4 n=1 Tax=Heracleum sosnowskyi TaxID=360622 RepID=A0AAD8IU18_9APIA|nr:filament-like plant protein 4 [Heracleum sosnowskyi]